MTDPFAQLTLFSRALRAERVPVGSDRIAAFCRAAELVPEELYWADRATLVARERDLTVYDAVYRRFFGGVQEQVSPPPLRRAVDECNEVGLASRLEVLREKSFALMSAEELAALAALSEGLPLAIPRRRSRGFGAGGREHPTCAGRSAAPSARAVSRSSAPSASAAAAGGASCCCWTSRAR